MDWWSLPCRLVLADWERTFWVIFIFWAWGGEGLFHCFDSWLLWFQEYHLLDNNVGCRVFHWRRGISRLSYHFLGTVFGRGLCLRLVYVPCNPSSCCLSGECTSSGSSVPNCQIILPRSLSDISQYFHKTRECINHNQIILCSYRILISPRPPWNPQQLYDIL